MKNAAGELQNCLYIMNRMIKKILVRENILDDKKYRFIYSVDEVNRKVSEGVPFREAYRQVAEDIESGNFTAGADKGHTHEGGIGNLCNDEIKEKMDKRLKQFNFMAKEIAVEDLLKQ